ncbi:helix-turn-helix domain-containing protein [Streptosporangium saharense]|uniref:DNA-binding transcriptional MerR regulator n=1 Tax=Streptosporangium saharense TaxID=1706840 RepID=A0A7W7QQD5_9ACTN|nr:MerR family transcriptional regulator [Streptosporangium saharense]MBB4917738.1 DNA-binding transcriptional MerR regulator [Streptosporangium saharense]
MEYMSDPASVSIGKAAALYDLAPSTLRWWESQRVLPRATRVNGRRVYSETDLRRIGLAYLCSVTGVMSLDQVSEVTIGRRNDLWHRTVKGQVRLLEQKIEELRNAHTYLMHLLECPDDDIVDECPWLDGELMSHTPRGRVAAESFVAAAQSTPRRTNASADRDETVEVCDETGVPLSRCAVCAGTFAQAPTGRRRRYCSRACQQRHYRETARERSARR